MQFLHFHGVLIQSFQYRIQIRGRVVLYAEWQHDEYFAVKRVLLFARHIFCSFDDDINRRVVILLAHVATE